MFHQSRKTVNSYFLKNIIQNKYDEIDVKILVYSVESIVPPYETYKSNVHRILVRFNLIYYSEGNFDFDLKKNATDTHLKIPQMVSYQL